MSPDTPEVAFIRNLAEALCDDPNSIEIEETTDEQGVLIRLYVAGSDLGRIIGRKGTTATAIRTLLRGLASKNGTRCSFKVNKRDAA
jgi:predicted RNA-binding protein YlqC (UPF0109 family)